MTRWGQWVAWMDHVHELCADKLINDEDDPVATSDRYYAMWKNGYTPEQAASTELAPEQASILRRCDRCWKEKPESEFPRPRRPDGRPRPFCHPCTNYVHWATS